MAAPMKTHMRVLIDKSVELEGFRQCHMVKIEDTRNIYGFELMIAELGGKT